MIEIIIKADRDEYAPKKITELLKYFIEKPETHAVYYLDTRSDYNDNVSDNPIAPAYYLPPHTTLRLYPKDPDICPDAARNSIFNGNGAAYVKYLFSEAEPKQKESQKLRIINMFSLGRSLKRIAIPAIKEVIADIAPLDAENVTYLIYRVEPEDDKR